MNDRHPLLRFAHRACLGAALLGLVGTTPAQDLRQTLERVCARETERQQLAGIQAAVWTRGTGVTCWAAGVANLELGAPMTDDTRLPIASVTKAMTGILYLQLVRDKTLEPQAVVQEFVPEFPRKAEGEITLDQLVGQTHGIRHYRSEVYPAFFTRRFASCEEALGIFADDEFVAPPGQRFTYSSYAYTLLGLALERATERPFGELLQTRVLAAAGMRATRPNDIRAPVPERASCYSHYEYTWPFAALEGPVCVPPLDMSYNPAGGNYLSTARDLVGLGRALVEGELLDRESMRLLTTSQTTRDGSPTGWSHGWFVSREDGRTELRINGSNPGSWAHLRVYPERAAAVAMLTNTWGIGSRERPKGLMRAMDEVHTALPIN